MNKEWQKNLTSPGTPLREVIKIIDSSSFQIAFVVDGDGRALGSVTDGDVRRAILRGLSLEDPIQTVMNSSPVIFLQGQSHAQMKIKMKKKGIRFAPVVDEDRKIVEIVTDGFTETFKRDNRIVIMAGGLGTRLKHLTENCPKPMLKIGNKPILETIIENLAAAGFWNFYISVNYLGEVIEEYFGDGSKWNLSIQYLKENQALGTAGALSLLPFTPTEPVLVMNGDLLTQVDFTSLLEFHLAKKAEATMCIREYDFQVPYGVVRLQGEEIQSIDEKPVQKFFVNGGIYVLSPWAISTLKKDTALDMPSLFLDLISKKKKVVPFPILEYWLDIGRLQDFERANGEFIKFFDPKE